VNFYQQGQYTALEKLGQAGLLGRMAGGVASAGRGVREFAKETGGELKDAWRQAGGFSGAKDIGGAWRNLAPEQQAMLKQYGAGAAVGGAAGGVAGGTTGGTGGAIAGGLGGAALGALGGRALGKGMLSRAQKGLAESEAVAWSNLQPQVRAQTKGRSYAARRREMNQADAGLTDAYADINHQMLGQAFPINRMRGLK